MFGALFGKKKQKSAVAAEEKLSSAVTSAIYNAVGARSIPSMPNAAQRAFQLATDPSAEARDFVGVIEADEALSARVLKIANSVFYDRGKRSTTIEESVLIIGMEELRGLLNANTLSEIFPCRHPARTQLWANDIATALISRAIARRIFPQLAENAFLGGLMHDVGKLLLLQRVTDNYARVLQQVEQNGFDFCKAEEQVFPFDHTQVGALIAEKWNFSPELITIIKNHHLPFPAEAKSGQQKMSLPQLVKAADLIAHSLGLGHPRNFGRLRTAANEVLPEIWEVLHIPGGEQKGFLREINRTFEIEYDLYAGNPIR